jgi:hypothetical protein
LGPCLPHGLAARFFVQHSGEKGVRQPCEGGKLRVRGAGRLQAPPAAACPVPRLGWLRRRLRRCLLLLGRAWLSIHHTGDGRTVRRSATSTASPAPPAAPGGRTRRRTPRGRWPHFWMVLSSLRRRMGARTSSRVLRWSPPLVRLPVVEVVASAGGTISATCRRASNSLALMASLSPPVGRRG